MFLYTYIILVHQKEGHNSEDLDACLSAAVSLTLPGEVLCMSALIQLKKFKKQGWRFERMEEIRK